MTTDVSSEVVKCPNCKEDVPKTLYCLNCGYPLYKQEKLVEEEPLKEEAEVSKVEEKTPEPQVEEVKEPESEVEEKTSEPTVEEVKKVEPEEPEDVVMHVEDEKPVEPESTVPEPLVDEKVEEVKTEPEAVKVEEPAASAEPEQVKVEEAIATEPVIQVEETKNVETEAVKTEEPVKGEAPPKPEIKVEVEAVKAEEPITPEPVTVKVEEPVATETPPLLEEKAVEPVVEASALESVVAKVEEIPAMPEVAKVEEPVVAEQAAPEAVKVEDSVIVEEAPKVEVAEVKAEIVEKPVEPVAVVEPVVDEPTVEVSKETVISVDDTSLSAGPVGLSAEASKMLDSYEEDTVAPYYVPDSLTKDLMESIAKNLTLKIRLVNLLREGKLKEQTFDRLYKGYVEDGQIWISRRDELIKRLNEEIDEQEDTYANSVHQLEILEVRKSIGEATEDEYAVKAPAYQWDVDHLDFEIGKKKNRVGYLEVISSVLPKDQINELKELASTQYNTIESLEVADEETIANIKSTLYDAIKILG